MRMRTMAVSLGSVALLLAVHACDETTSVGQLEVYSPSITANVQGRALTLDDFFSQVAADVPGFAGAYLDESGELEIGLTDIRQEAAAKAAVAQYRVVGRSLGAGRIVDAQYDFLQLANWRTRLTEGITNVAELVSVDIDERQNRLVIGIETARGLRRIEDIMGQLDVPSEAVVLKIRKRVSPGVLDLLIGRVRPTEGGIQIRNDDDACTLGFNAIHDGKDVFSTASHCSDDMWENDDTNWGQSMDSAQYQIGIEYLDPEPVDTSGTAACPVWPAGTPCRRSDATLAEYHDSVTVVVGMIARTTYRRQWNGSIVIDSSNEHFFVTDSVLSPLSGQELNKIGKATGWTYGSVDETCVAFSEAGRVYHCQYTVAGGFADGDSGAPVFFRNSGEDFVALMGIAWAGAPNISEAEESDTSDARWVMSSLGGLVYDFGSFDQVTYDTTPPPPPPLTVTINGPDEVKPNQSCYYYSSVSGGSGGYTYQWVKNVVPIGTNSDVNVSTSTSSYLLKLTVWSGSGSTGSNQISVTNTSSADLCFN